MKLRYDVAREAVAGTAQFNVRDVRFHTPVLVTLVAVHVSGATSVAFQLLATVAMSPMFVTLNE